MKIEIMGQDLDRKTDNLDQRNEMLNFAKTYFLFGLDPKG
jgi:hypothetical protein